MPRFAQVGLKFFAFAAAAFALLLAVVWPWPAPEVDWRTPVERALTRSDCAAAVKITETAAAAGSIDAIRKLAGFRQGGVCKSDRAGETVDGEVSFVILFRKHNATAESIYSLDKYDLGFFRRPYVWATAFLCAMPYNGLNGVDNAALSEALAAPATPLVALHRARRRTCIAILEDLAEQLVDADDVGAKEVAYQMLTYPPLGDTPKANLHYARLLLAQAFVPAWLAGNDGLTSHFRDLAWLRLERAARAGDLHAIRLMVTQLHTARFHVRDDKEAYYWLLRLRRLGGARGDGDEAIETGLSDDDRITADWREELDSKHKAK